MKKYIQITISFVAILLFLNLTFPAYAGPGAFVLGTVFLLTESRKTKGSIRPLLYRLVIICFSSNMIALILTIGMCGLLKLFNIDLPYCDMRLQISLFGVSAAFFLFPWIAVLIMALAYKLKK